MKQQENHINSEFVLQSMSTIQIFILSKKFIKIHNRIIMVKYVVKKNTISLADAILQVDKSTFYYDIMNCTCSNFEFKRL